MKPENDITDYIKERLATAKRSPSDQLWGRVEDSLDKRRKRRMFIYFFSALVGVALIVLFLLPTHENTPSDQNPTIVESKNPNAKELEPTVNELMNDSVKESAEELVSEEMNNSTEGFEEDLPAQSLPTGDPEVSSVGEDPKIEKLNGALNGELNSEELSPQSLKGTKLEDSVLGEDSEVSTTYYYFNSEDNEQVITKNKKEMDSILSKVNDSMRVINKDTIH